jgi:hypothetical protein
MEWLSQNALWILFAVGMIVLMRRGGMMCGMGRHRHGFDGGSKHPDEIPRDPVTGHPVDKDKALVSIFQGTPIYSNRKAHVPSSRKIHSNSHITKLTTTMGAAADSH